ncbi:MAG: glycoside hydrolase family 3 C-terminal domain-containing protein [Ignavibacteriales bacterium]|nr:glycoside hydrolase family 3 C-terminal domain-containing protein [Ignavibacteriales bacterium]
MKLGPILIIASVSLSLFTLRAQTSVDHRTDSLIALMTPDEKVGQLVQYSRSSAERETLLRQGKIGSFLNITGAKATREVQRIAVEETRLKIPLLFGLDVIHGFRTTFPIPLATSCSWELELIEKSERVAAVEATAAGVNWTFSPMVDIARDPRWGRIAEGGGEDPYLGAAIAAARVRGLQGNDLRSPTSLLACAKHFAAYGGAEGGRDYNTVDISERTLREIYLPPFKAAVDAGAGSFMCSFNEIAGMPSSANRKLLTDILRGEWKFNGFVVSDWNSIGELVPHGLAATLKDAAVLGLKAGIDMDMEANAYHDHLATLVKEGRVSETELNEAVRRVLRAKFRLGLFDNPYKNCDVDREKRDLLTSSHREAARAMAQRSIVLLKNTGRLLPLSGSVKTIAVIGPLADDKKNPLGSWHAAGSPDDVVSVLDGIKLKAGTTARVVFARGCDLEKPATDGYAEALAAARAADVVIAVVGEAETMSGEASSRSSLGLPGSQEELVRALLATGKPLVVALMNGRPLAIDWIAQHVPAILETWFLGVETGNAIADVIFGDYNPSGKLTTSFPRATGQVPIYYNHKNSGRPANDTVHYTSKYLDLENTPLFPFGYGLSYSSFVYSQLELSSKILKEGGNLLVHAVVKNTGDRGGEEIVQLYVRDEVASVTRPVKELRGFQKVTLAPGESKRVQFTLNAEQLKFYDRDMKWTIEPGAFTVYVGPSSAEGLETRFEYQSR